MSKQLKKRQHKALRISLFSLAFMIVIVTLATIGIGRYFINYALVPSGDGGNREVIGDNDTEDLTAIQKIIEVNRKQADEQAEGWSEHVTHQEVSIKSFDDLTLKGTIYQAIESTTKWVILAHGYHSNPTSVLSVAEQFHAKGFNVLSISMRAHAKSEGNYIGMGWLDRKDLLDWIDYVITNDSNAQIILHGTSMGGAAVTMASGEELPPNVKAIINDCGYTSVWDIFASELKLRFNLPAFPVLHMVNLVANFQVGYNFKEASALKQVKNSRVPMLFIHGDRDDFVPVEMAHQLYEVATVEKELLIIEGASHAEAKFAEPDVYYSHVFSFVDKYMKS